MIVARLHCRKSVHRPKKFDLAHQTVSPRERVGSGDETKHLRPNQRFVTAEGFYGTLQNQAMLTEFNAHAEETDFRIWVHVLNSAGDKKLV